jgi:hypothetical protein
MTRPHRTQPATDLGAAAASTVQIPRAGDPPAEGNNPEHGDAPRYLLDFKVPNLTPGLYAYVIYCDACLKGRRGSPTPSPGERPWEAASKRSRPSARVSLLPRTLRAPGKQSLA